MRIKNLWDMLNKKEQTEVSIATRCYSYYIDCTDETTLTSEKHIRRLFQEAYKTVKSYGTACNFANGFLSMQGDKERYALHNASNLRQHANLNEEDEGEGNNAV